MEAMFWLLTEILQSFGEEIWRRTAGKIELETLVSQFAKCNSDADWKRGGFIFIHFAVWGQMERAVWVYSRQDFRWRRVQICAQVTVLRLRIIITF